MNRTPRLRDWFRSIKRMSVDELLEERTYWLRKDALKRASKVETELVLRGVTVEVLPEIATASDPTSEEASIGKAVEAIPLYDASLDPKRRTGKSRVMYIEYKGDGLAGTAWIGRVHLSKTGKMLYYRDQRFQSLKGGYKANYYDVETGDNYWISGCKKDGDDTLYPGSIEVDEDVREEYWLKIRKKPECVHLKQFRSEGKYSKRRPK